MLPQQPEDAERCESVELDNKIRDLIERNASLDPKGVPPEATQSRRHPCPLKCAQSSRRKNLTDPLEQKIRCLEKQRKELLAVNQQWDQQFRSMKELYERKVVELRTKLRAAEGALSALEWERRSQSAGGAGQDPRREEERENLNEELQELKKENKCLKEKNALASKSKEHYEREIQRLNQALQDVLEIEGAPSSEDCGGKCAAEPSLAAMRTEVGVLRQQVQIYEDDFRKERSDPERLSREKEELQRLHQAARAQVARLSSQIKVCQMEKEKLEKQLKQQDHPRCTRDPFRPEELPKEEAVSSVKKAHQ